LPPEGIDLRDLKDVETRHKEAGLQNEAFARNTEQARSAALRIVREDGTIVLDELPELMRDLPFSRSGENITTVMGEVGRTGVEHLPPSKHVQRMLKFIKENEEVRNAIANIRAPAPDNPASDMIRATLGLPNDAVLTDAHAKRAAVAALLTQMRQVDV